MTSRLTLRSSAPHGGRAWELDAVPHAYEEAGRQQFHAFPGVRWVRDPATPTRRGFYRGAAEVVKIVVALLESAGVIRVRDESNDAARIEPVALEGPIEPADLRPYQVDGAAWVASMLRHSGAALLADEMGIGKSAQAIRALDALGSGTVLIVCPAIVRRHWHAQCARWCATAPHLRAFHVLSYEGFTRAWKRGEVPAVTWAIIDEIHYAANARSQRSKALAEWRAARAVRGVVALSGTPMTVRPRDLWHVFELLWPGRFGREFEFQKRYCDGRFVEIPKIEKHVWQAEGATRIEELSVRLAAVMLRRTKAGVGLELPPRTRTVIEVELPAKAARDLSRASSAIDWRKPNGATISSLLSGVEAYKIDAAIELAKDALAAGSRVLLLTTRKATARALGEALSAPVADGDVTADKRQALLVDAPCGVATMYAVTTGIDLVGYDVVIFTGLDWVPSTILQAEARVHRIGQMRAVSVYFLVGLRTLDEVVRSRVIERLDTFAQLAGDAGDERDMSADLGGGTEDSLLAEIAAALGGIEA